MNGLQRPSSRVLAVLSALAVLAGVGWWTLRPVRPPNVLLITVDTLRADRLGCYGARTTRTPHIDRLAREGSLFEAATAPMPMTRPSHFSIFTARYPRQHGVMNNETVLAPELPTVTEVFRANGYRTAAFVGARVLAESSGAARGFEVFEAPKAKERRAQEVVAHAAAWMTSPGRRAPFFAWVHLFDPHTPYAPQHAAAAPGALRVAEWGLLASIAHANGGDLPQRALEEAKALYGAEVEYTDGSIGDLLDTLAQSHQLDDTIVVFTADHGECFDHGVYFEHVGCMYEGALHVPLIIRFPPRVAASRRRAEVVEHLDLAPTLLSLAGVAPAPSFEGRDLFTEPGIEATAFLEDALHTERAVRQRERQRERLPSVAGERLRPLRPDHRSVGVRSKQWKLLRLADGEELYDVRADPSERDNRVGEEHELAAALGSQLDRWMEMHPLPGRAAVAPDAETLETLRALGYVE